MIPLVLIVSIVTGVGYYYYNYIYRSPGAVESRELTQANSAYEYLLNDSEIRVTEKDYEYKVLINPVCGGADYGLTAGGLRESLVVLDIADYVDSLNTDESLGIFYTRITDTNPLEEQRLKFIETIDPDMIIELRLNGSIDSNAIGTSVLYDDGYYDYHITNAHLADIMEKNVVTAIGGVAEGIFPLKDGESEYIKGCHVPAAVIRCGYITNAKEAQALGSETYKSNLAQGILNGINEARNEKPLTDDGK